jgi:hypothetical protein
MLYKVGFLTSEMNLMGCVMKLCEPTIVKCSSNDFFQSKEAKMLEIELKKKNYWPLHTCHYCFVCNYFQNVVTNFPFGTKSS